ncbi:4a-hydroxytetrahydrobiopterin dehydratase [Crenobacter caeni]|uniref:Putative pterin-4-alpha-carbinolamine dehydratase n=1 Tax=Crenobacter caeni TaxID=2705474 RepID=A0A6B2KV17_9NEIS|nr:4a-hydroxytetrahydrobiopterin dehydratase [Crenobacter caeni]NDV14001.1 4a-hydroxytetrahydrobiopterin dehydratase [Crenobacter caeni]
MKLTELECRAGAPRLGAVELDDLMDALPDWQLDGDALTRECRFADYYRTIAFVNALAWVAHQADHHPDLSVHYNRVVVRFGTHDAGGVTLNDLICAARCDALLEQRA